MSALLLWLPIGLPLKANDYEQWVCCDGQGGALLAARGPAEARYDAARDVTDAVFRCAHTHCKFAAQIQGDARVPVSRHAVLLRSSVAPPSRDTQPMSKPMTFETFGGTAVVANETVIVWTVVRPAGPLVLMDILLVALVIGVVMAWGSSRLGLITAGAGSVAGLLVTPLVLSSSREPSVLLGLLVLLGLVSTASLAFFLRRSRHRRLALATLLFAVLIIVAWVAQAPFFPLDPTL